MTTSLVAKLLWRPSVLCKKEHGDPYFLSTLSDLCNMITNWISLLLLLSGITSGHFSVIGNNPPSPLSTDMLSFKQAAKRIVMRVQFTIAKSHPQIQNISSLIWELRTSGWGLTGYSKCCYLGWSTWGLNELNSTYGASRLGNLVNMLFWITNFSLWGLIQQLHRKVWLPFLFDAIGQENPYPVDSTVHRSCQLH